VVRPFKEVTEPPPLDHSDNRFGSGLDNPNNTQKPPFNFSFLFFCIVVSICTVHGPQKQPNPNPLYPIEKFVNVIVSAISNSVFYPLFRVEFVF
jgi:hypothetical protein